MRIVTGFVAIVLGAQLVCAADVGPTRDAFVATTDPLGEPVKKVVYLEQNWSPAQSVQFYFTEQGSQIIPYDWFLALEQPDSATPFRDNQNILRYRYLAQNAGDRNPDGLPVGFVAGKGGMGRQWLGLTCAACHTKEIRLGDTAYRIDGAPTQGDVQGLLAALTDALQKTRRDPQKFARFTAKVLGANNDSTNQADLAGQLDGMIDLRVGYNLRNFGGYNPNLPQQPPPTRYARLDAVGAIVNEVYFHAAKAAEVTPISGALLADAPVSYPFLWDTPQHDLVQWLGIAKSGGPLDILSLSRNVGEVLGVFGEIEIPEKPTLLHLGYASSIKVVELEELENLVKSLWAPQWPADFPKIDQDAAAKGSKLYQTNCVACHALIDRKDPNRKVKAVMNDSGTDPRASNNFFGRTGPSGKLNGVNVNFVPFTPKFGPIAEADSMLSHEVIGIILNKAKEVPLEELQRIGFRGVQPKNVPLVAVRQGARYKSRPLDGIWATAPYLHNGSVPNLDALLRPLAERPTSFTIGVKTFDPVRVGYLTDAPGFPKFNVNNPDGSPSVGNSNAGHVFGASLTAEERGWLLEYLKTL
jgi:processive rubber oxygenase RoxA-like protein